MDEFADWLLQQQPASSRSWLREDVQVSNILFFNELLSVQTQSILNADLVPWMDGFASSSGDGIIGVTRIVWIVRDHPTTFTKLSLENLRYLFDHFELQRARSIVQCYANFWGGKLSPTKKQSFALRYHRGLAMAWNYDFLTNKTEAVFEGKVYWSLKLQDVIQSQQRLGLHPLFIGLVVVFAAFRDLMAKFHMINLEIQSVESRTRHNIALGAQAAAGGSYAFLSTKMSGQAQAVVFCETDYALMLQNLDWLLEFQWPQDVEKPTWWKRVAEDFEECSHLVRRALKGWEPTIRQLSKRADIQLTAVSHASCLSPK